LKQLCSYLLMLVLAAIAIAVRADPVTISAFGDSITRGYPDEEDNANGIPNNGGYIPTLQSQLNAEDWEATVLNFGYPGERVSVGTIPGKHRISVDDGYPYAVLGSNPDYVLIMEGTNDLPMGIGPGAVADALRSVIDQVLADEKIPVIGTLLPRFDKNSWVDIPGLNSDIHELATSKNIELADLYHASSNWQSLLTSDNLHPNPTGYSVMAGEWFDALVRYKEEQDRIAEEEAAKERARIAGSLQGPYLLLLTD
jgi:lysophospholipase L1-like esterase